MFRVRVKTLIFLFILFTWSASSAEDNFSELIPQVSSPTIVGGVVDVISGHFILPDVQLKIAGPVPYNYGWNHTQSLMAVRGTFANGFDSSSHSYMVDESVGQFLQ